MAPSNQAPKKLTKEEELLLQVTLTFIPALLG